MNKNAFLKKKKKGTKNFTTQEHKRANRVTKWIVNRNKDGAFPSKELYCRENTVSPRISSNSDEQTSANNQVEKRPITWIQNQVKHKRNKKKKVQNAAYPNLRKYAIIKLKLCPQKSGFSNIFVPLFLYLWPKSIGKRSIGLIYTLTKRMCHDLCNHILSQTEQDATQMINGVHMKIFSKIYI